MKRLFSVAFAAALSVAAFAQSEAPAFPGAEGHGRYVTGGRGGEVRVVTSLVDDGKTTTKGTLRWAVNGNSKKIVVFNVGGIVELVSDLKIGQNTTIEGQTAPAPGITVRYFTVRPNSNNIIRFMRFRRGDEKDVNDGDDAIWQRQKTGIILDHCSMSWSNDEIASFYDNNNFTMQWCTLGEALNYGHTKGSHSYGAIWGGKLASFHHNMICHVKNRAPRFNGARYGWADYTDNSLYSTYKWENTVQAENVDFRNCLIYNAASSGACYGGPGGGQINIINNYYKAGPSKSSLNVTAVSVATSENADKDHPKLYSMTSRYYIDGNTTVTSKGVKTENRDWNGVSYDDGVFTINGEKYSLDTNNYYGDAVEHVANSNGDMCVKIKMDEPAPTGEVTTHSAANAYEKILLYGGSSLDRDAVDVRYMDEAKNGTTTYTGSVNNLKGIIDLVSDQGTYELTSSSRDADFDTDGDGIPDAWETANGLDPNDASDAALYTLDTDKGYYSNLEVYLNSLVQDIMVAENEDAESSVTEYYPAYTKEDGTKVAAINGTTGINNLVADTDIVETSYYNLQGMKVASPSKGVYVKVGKTANGKTLNQKIIVK